MQAESEPAAERPGPETADLQPRAERVAAGHEPSTVDAEKSDELPFDLNQAMFDEPDGADAGRPRKSATDLPFENLGRTATRRSPTTSMEQLRLVTDDPAVLAASARRSSATSTRTATCARRWTSSPRSWAGRWTTSTRRSP